ncbi:hypothetical protein AC578_5900 [Pseudocercospora eumusae]|uniref:Uncharacterized protein n=1 Tax=Pseudocercospora eumusae TaxID=321146 RepID=A0A139HBN7_9PEZI|nr:hypothetical protein AC578_5900 [Pseudocercospora eumusae]
MYSLGAALLTPAPSPSTYIHCSASSERKIENTLRVGKKAHTTQRSTSLGCAAFPAKMPPQDPFSRLNAILQHLGHKPPQWHVGITFHVTVDLDHPTKELVTAALVPAGPTLAKLLGRIQRGKKSKKERDAKEALARDVVEFLEIALLAKDKEKDSGSKKRKHTGSGKKKGSKRNAGHNGDGAVERGAEAAAAAEEEAEAEAEAAEEPPAKKQCRRCIAQDL